jgi:hypothetical protein
MDSWNLDRAIILSDNSLAWLLDSLYSDAVRPVTDSLPGAVFV